MWAHTVISLITISLLCIAMGFALLLGFQNYLLKHHQGAKILSLLPPLQTMEKTLFKVIGGCLILLSAALMSGFLLPQQGHLIPKTILSLLSWILLSLLLIGRYLFGWRGPTAIRWTLWGTVLSFLAYFGTK